jgi:hypothetical protein
MFMLLFSACVLQTSFGMILSPYQILLYEPFSIGGKLLAYIRLI